MSDELIHAEQLMNDGKLEEAYEFLSNIEEKNKLLPIDQLSVLILKGKIFGFKRQFKKSVELGELAYQLSKGLGVNTKRIDALLLKANVAFLGELDVDLKYTLEAEDLLKFELNQSSSLILERKTDISYIRAVIHYLKGNLKVALELTMECLSIHEKKNRKDIRVAYFLLHIAFIYIYLGEYDKGLYYAERSLALQKKLGNKFGIAASMLQIGIIYANKGELNESIKFARQALSVGEISNRDKSLALFLLGGNYNEKGEVDRAIKYYEQGFLLADENPQLIIESGRIGVVYMIKGDYTQAIKYLEQSLTLSEEMGYSSMSIYSLCYLILIYIDRKAFDQVQKYVALLKERSEQSESKLFNQGYLFAKALELKAKGLSRNRAEAELLLKQLINEDYTILGYRILCIVTLCDLYLEELSVYNVPEVFDDLNPLILRLIEIAEKQNSYLYLAEVKLLQAKLALVQMNFEEAKFLITQAQRIAEMHGLDLLAIKISSEHDKILDHLNDWDNLKDRDAPISERVELASLNGNIERIQRKRAIDPPDLLKEDPMLLLIIAEGGFLIFSYPFTDEWKFDDELFSGFLTAFNSISDEIFAVGLDRAKFGQNTVLMESVANFFVCYLFKGQTYVAQQKLRKFSEQIQNSAQVVDTLNKYYETSQVLELKDLPSLGSLVTEIFISDTLDSNL
ncbi:MAG: tetratricopeptide repeat protein [Promethearchaeota archaeon]|jgi:tetratricopeptide (TPR) repeat protein